MQRNFERRKVSIGTCARAFGTPCAHEHACVHCPMLRPDPGQRTRLLEIGDNLRARIDEARREGWLGEMSGLEISLAASARKLAEMDELAAHHSTVITLGLSGKSLVVSGRDALAPGTGFAGRSPVRGVSPDAQAAGGVRVTL